MPVSRNFEITDRSRRARIVNVWEWPRNRLVIGVRPCAWYLHGDKGGGGDRNGPPVGLPAADGCAQRDGGLGSDGAPAIGARAATSGGVGSVARRPARPARRDPQGTAAVGAVCRAVVYGRGSARVPGVLHADLAA